MSDVLYQVNAYDHTPLEAANEFASKWFDCPRLVDGWNEETSTFQLVNGTAIYEVVHKAGILGVSSPILQIKRL